MRNPELWTHIRIHPLVAPEHEDAFLLKLMQGEKWTLSFAKGAIEEYRRFLYLTQVMTSEATPSGPVDAVWHLHMTYTRDYWQGLCRDVLGRDLHHNPGAGPEEMPRFIEQYEQTKRWYQDEFGHAPDRKFWPHARAASFRAASWISFALAVILALIYMRLGPENAFLRPLAAGLAAISGMAGVIFANLGYGLGNSNGAACGGGGDCGASCGSGCGGD